MTDMELTPEQELNHLVNALSAEFDALCQERHNLGATKYGPFAFLGKDMMEEAMAEVLDLSNYARYCFIKLRMMQIQIQTHQQEFDAWRQSMIAAKEAPLHGFTPTGGDDVAQQ